jgi:hypothetical protein
MKSTKKITFCAILSALCVVIMLVSYFPYLTYAVPAFASLIMMVILIELGLKWSFFSYLTASFLVFLFAETESKILFIMFFGFYPIIKAIIEKIGKPIIEWCIKFLVFNSAVLSAYFILTKLFMLPMDDLGDFQKYGTAILLLMANVVFVFYDIVITKMAVTYIAKFHSRVSKFL